jgi:hypothetical protein
LAESTASARQPSKEENQMEFFTSGFDSVHMINVITPWTFAMFALLAGAAATVATLSRRNN